MAQSKRIWRGTAGWLKLFSRQSSSGLSVPEFCRREGINAGLFDFDCGTRLKNAAIGSPLQRERNSATDQIVDGELEDWLPSIRWLPLMYQRGSSIQRQPSALLIAYYTCAPHAPNFLLVSLLTIIKVITARSITCASLLQHCHALIVRWVRNVLYSLLRY
jgi:hypothetical protein